MIISLRCGRNVKLCSNKLYVSQTSCAVLLEGFFFLELWEVTRNLEEIDGI
jgi:hypothetical protein